MDINKGITSQPSVDEMADELATIERINRGLDNPQLISSRGTENSLQHLLEIPELAEFEGPDNETIDYVESFVNDPGEQKLVSIFSDDDVQTDLEDGEEADSPGFQSAISTENSNETRENVGSILEDRSDSSPSQSKYFFSKLFGTKEGASSPSSSASSKTSYFSRLFSRQKSDAASPVSNSSIPSCTSENDEPEVDAAHMALAEQLIEETEAQAPAGTPHLSSLARSVDRPILAFSSSMTLRHHAGRGLEGRPILIQFHSARPGMATGHWTLLGNRDPEGLPEVMNLNNCLFNVVCAQTGQKPSVLRKKTISEMRKHIKSLSRRIEVMLRKEQCEELVILVGGAAYGGSSSRDAQRVIDDSQRGTCHPGRLQGHPRGHASHPGASGPTESAENYSRGGWKTGFLSRDDQDSVGHMALQTRAAQQAMDALNRGSDSEAVRLNPSELSGSLPQGAEFRNGNMESPRPIRQLVLVLRHHTGHADDPSYPVFVHTFYPVVT